jgi:hypothetical protein
MTVRQGQWYRTISRFQPDAFKGVADALELPPIIRWLMAKGRNTSGLAAMLPLVMEALLQDEKRIHVKESLDVDPDPEILGLPGYAFDMHTAIGRQAIGRFAKFLSEKYWQWFGAFKASQFSTIVGMALFHVEGSRLDRALNAPALHEYRERIEAVELDHRGFPGHEARQLLYRILGLEASALWELRDEVAKAVYWRKARP